MALRWGVGLFGQVAIAVERHSTYHESPFIRMWDTLCLAAALVQGTVSDRQLSLKYIGAKHGAIKGEWGLQSAGVAIER